MITRVKRAEKKLVANMDLMRHWHTDKRKFKNSWQHKYFFTEIKSTAVCLICTKEGLFLRSITSVVIMKQNICISSEDTVKRNELHVKVTFSTTYFASAVNSTRKCYPCKLPD